MPSKLSCKKTDKNFSPPNTGCVFPMANSESTTTNNVAVDEISCANILSPSSIASSSTMEAPPHCSFSLRKGNHTGLFPRKRSQLDRMFDYSHWFNRNYAIAMTKLHFQMQRKIYQLQRRTDRIERILKTQQQYRHPIIRIPRLTQNDLSAASLDNNQPDNISVDNQTSLQNQHDNDFNDLPHTDQNQSAASSIENQTTPENITELSPSIGRPHCLICNQYYSTQQRYSQHIQKFHAENSAKSNANITQVEEGNLHNNEANVNSHESGISAVISNDSNQLSINHWDCGEGRLRPRSASRQNVQQNHKVKCGYCQKLYRASSIKAHVDKKHRKGLSPSISDASDLPELPVYPAAPESSSNQEVAPIPTPNNISSSELNIAPMDLDDEPIEFLETESDKRIIFVVTCLERHQMKTLDDFAKKFSEHVQQSPTVNMHTTHLIVNDENQPLRSPLSLKFLQSIANHCYCISFRWILACLQYDRLVPEESYEIEGVNNHNMLLGGPRRSRVIDKRHSLLEEYCFIIKCTEDNENRMSNDCLKDLLTTSGGKIIDSVTPNLLNDYTILVICDRSYLTEHRSNYESCRSVGVRFVSLNWVVESILEYRPKPIQNYEEQPH